MRSSRAPTIIGVILCTLVVIMGGAATAPVATASPTTTAQTQQSQAEVNVSPSNLPGDGSESNPYEISNASELQAIEDDLDASYMLVSDIDASATANTNDGKGFDPLGNTSEPFTGTFNGQGHTITELTINRPSERKTGLFAQIGTFDDQGETEIQQVTLRSVSVVGDFDVGGLVGIQRGGQIRSVTVSGAVSGNGDVGGLTGESSATIRNISVDIEVSAARRTAGGIAGEASGTIQNVSASGSVTGNFTVGGIAGKTGGTIQDSSASVSVTAKQSTAGGIAGETRGTIQNVSATGDVTTSDGLAGGLVGDANFASIQGAVATGTVITRSGSKTGGLVGRLDDDAKILNSSASGDVRGEFTVGGLAGQIDGTVQNASATGNIHGVESVGGFVGRGSGNIQDVIAVGRVSGQQDIGGFAGSFRTQGPGGGQVEDAYWDTQATEQPISAGGTGLTTAQMEGNAALTNMSGLLFGSIWQTVSGNYPELIALADSDTDSDSDSDSGSEASPTVSVSRSPSSSEIAPGEAVTLTTEITGVSGSVSTSSTYQPPVASATVRSVTVNGASVNPILSEATANGSTVTLGDVGSDVTVTITEELTVSEELNVTHQITGDVTAGETTTEFEPVSVTVTDIEPQSPVDEFDTDGNGDIEITELGQAGQAFASGQISITELGEVGAAFAS